MEACPQQHLGGKNVPNLEQFFTTFDFDHKYLEQIHITKIEKALDQPQPLPYWTKRFGELWSTNKKVISSYISALRGCCPVKFLHALQPLNCTSSQTWGTGRPQVWLCHIFLVSFLSPQDLRVPSAECHETLPRDQYVRQFYNACPKFGSLCILGTSQDIQNRKYMRARTIPHSFSERSPVNLIHYPESRTCEFGPNQVGFFREIIFWPLGDAGPSNLYTR